MRSATRTLIAAGLVLAALPAAAPAATTVGSSLRQRADLYVRCSSVCTAAQSARPGGAGLVIPVDGILTRWRVRAATLGMVRLRVVRPEDDGTWTAVASGEWVRLDRSHAPGEDVLYTFPARIAVRAGDAIALDRDAKAGGIFHSYGQEPSYAVAEFSPPLAEDAVRRQPTSVRAGRELLLNADVENDGDGDGFGDDSQDNCPTIPNDQTDRPCTTDAPRSGETTGPTSETIGNTPRRGPASDGPPVRGERPLARGPRRHSRRRGPRARPPRASDPRRRHGRRGAPRPAPRRPAREEAGAHRRDGPSRPRPVVRRRPSARHERGGARERPPATRAPSGRAHDRAERRARPPRRRERPARGHGRPPRRPAPSPPPPPGWQSHG